jgi:leucyl/phenylalanyl-tRNA---protein transferase
MSTGPRLSQAKIFSADAALAAYRIGFFPMADPKSEEIFWYSPDPRAILPLQNFHVSRSLRQEVARGRFAVSLNRAFPEVIWNCAERDETWISRDITRVYCELHAMGYAHSIETWKDGVLVGGLYGISLSGAFFGESMFSRVSNASKVALVHLVRRLQQRNFLLLDSQFMNDHIRQFGAVDIPRALYLSLLREALDARISFLDPE